MAGAGPPGRARHVPHRGVVYGLGNRGQDRLQQIMPGGYFSGIGITLIILLIAAPIFGLVQAVRLGQQWRAGVSGVLLSVMGTNLWMAMDLSDSST